MFPFYEPLPIPARRWFVMGVFLAVALGNAVYALATGDVVAEVAAYLGFIGASIVSHLDYREEWELNEADPS